MSRQPPGKGVGRVFMIVAWCAGLYLATQFFGRWEQRQANPNTEVASEQGVYPPSMDYKRAYTLQFVAPAAAK